MSVNKQHCRIVGVILYWVRIVLKESGRLVLPRTYWLIHIATNITLNELSVYPVKCLVRYEARNIKTEGMITWVPPHLRGAVTLELRAMAKLKLPRGNRSNSKEKSSSHSSSATNLTWNHLALNPMLRAESTVPKHLSYSTTSTSYKRQITSAMR
jgi:hypothetical protein